MEFRPDQSDYVAHFTKDADVCGNIEPENGDNVGISSLSAKKRLISILEKKVIYASPMPWTGAKAVCFTECPWMSIVGHTKRYSPYGIGFKKPFIFSRNGGPAFYVRSDLLREQSRKWAQHLYPFVTPFWPEYRPNAFKKRLNLPSEKDEKTCDYTHEREWRVPHNLTFDYKDVAFIVLKDYNDMAQFPKPLKDSIGREKFILVDNYKITEHLWPAHRL